ncbi:terminase TerL endonuclease subunit [Aeromonas hydrophila]|uniref:terminase TerL endonuclease subunit n=1 Tax=Aeromonas hydrophila TaxID=644 RepID=UPI00235FA987|nr:terminase TerL endonuclease subunit [Aeromonas hydrophila]
MRTLESMNHRVHTPNHKDPLGNTLFDNYCISVKGAEQYAYDVITGAINTSPYIVGACNRFLKDLNRTDITFNKKKASAALAFTLLMKFPKGYMKGSTMTLSDWQVFFMVNIYGFYYVKDHPNKELAGARRFTTSALWCGRGNAKSTLASSIMIIENLMSENDGSYVISAGPRLEQSLICVNDMKSYIAQSPDLKGLFNTKNSKKTVCTTNIVNRETGKINKRVVYTQGAVAGAGKLDGFRITLGVCDELHAHPDATLKGDLESGLGGKQKDTMLLLISTAGFNSLGFAAKEMGYGIKVATGEVDNDRYFALVYAVPPEHKEDYANEKLWEWANPNLGKSVTLASIRSICVKAKQGYLEDRNNLLTKYMNIYSDEATDSYINIHDLKKCRNPDLNIKDFIGKPCYLGLDLASFRDLASLTYVFPDKDKLTVFQKSYFSRDAMGVLPIADQDIMISAQNAGELVINEGAIIDHDIIKQDVIEAHSSFNVKAFSLDSAALGVRFAEEINALNKKVKPIEVFQGFGLSFPITRVKEHILTGNFEYNDTLLEYAFRNAVEFIGALKGESMLKKKNEHHKIDPAVSLMTAVASIPVYKAPKVYKVSGS